MFLSGFVKHSGVHWTILWYSTKVVKGDLIKTIRTGRRVAIAAVCFSIYLYVSDICCVEDTKGVVRVLYPTVKT